ncbi:hypothetical protein [Caballeronia arationis]|uniref:hypothetical protein n=1 Tax=Caballeronia arationis TaxID=1777142 RepID=UPI001F337BD3|nr:hypothetical protein [Caballeronia arationis]
MKWHDGTPFTSADVQYSIMEVSKKVHPIARPPSPGSPPSICPARTLPCSTSRRRCRRCGRGSAASRRRSCRSPRSM